MSDSDWSDYEEFQEEEYLPDLKSCISYEIISDQDIKKRQSQAIQKLSEEFGLEYTQSAVFLIKNNWNPQQVISKLLDSTLELPELSRRQSKNYSESLSSQCLSCYCEYPGLDLIGMDCSHYLCKSCYKEFLIESINQGPESIFTKCPIPECSLIVAQEIFEKLLPKNSLERYKKFLFNSFVDSRTDVKWCPSPECLFAAIYPKKRAREIICKCGYSWCFLCGKESHRPLSCEMLDKWNFKLSSDDSQKWLLANTKKCPKCKNAIEKNLGCMHMTCKCGHEFCWLCLGPWQCHGDKTGGYYNCNQFKVDREKGLYKSEETKRKKAINDLKRFEHYYDRYINHKASLRKAGVKVMISKNAVELMYSMVKEAKLFDFYLEAAELIYQSKRSLAYTYAVGYFLNSKNKIRFFEFIQGELESNMIRLDKLIEKDLESFLEVDSGNNYLKKGFSEFRIEVLDLDRVVKKYFDECLKQIEAGFPDVQDGGEEDSDIYTGLDINYSNMWICTACTLANSIENRECGACRSVRLA